MSSSKSLPARVFQQESSSKCLPARVFQQVSSSKSLPAQKSSSKSLPARVFELDLFFTGCYHLGCDKLMFLSFQFSYFNFFIFMFVLIRHLNCIFGAERCNRWRFHRRSLAVGHWFKRRFSAQTNYVATIIVMILAPKLKIFQMNQNKQYTHHRKCKD